MSYQQIASFYILVLVDMSVIMCVVIYMRTDHTPEYCYDHSHIISFGDRTVLNED